MRIVAARATVGKANPRLKLLEFLSFGHREIGLGRGFAIYSAPIRTVTLGYTE